MALKYIDFMTMLSITTHWRSTARAVFDRPLLAALPAQLDALAARFAALHAQSEGEQVEIAALTRQARDLDARHDALLDRVYTFLTSAAQLYGDHPRGERLLELRDRLMPDGLSMKQRTFQAQGGAVERARAAFTAEDRALLAEVSLPGTDLAALVDDWIEAGSALRQVDTERTAKLQQPSAAPISERDLRIEWMRLAALIRAAADYSGDLDEAERALLFAQLDESVAQARNRARRRRAAGDAGGDLPPERADDPPHEESDPAGDGSGG